MSVAGETGHSHSPSASTHPASRSTSAPADAKGSYARHVAVTDLAVLVVSVLIAQVAHFGFALTEARTTYGIGYTTLGVCIAAAWWIALYLSGSRSRNVIGSGAEEYQRILNASFLLFGVLAIISLLLDIALSRAYLAITFPLGLVGLMVARHQWRRWLSRQRSMGRMVSRVLVVGGTTTATEIACWFARHPGDGLQVAAVWVPDRLTDNTEWLKVADRLVPAYGTQRSFESVLELADADMVVVSDADHIGHRGLRELTWQLEEMGVELLVSPNVMDVSRSRIAMRNISSMPFLHVKEPQYSDAGNWPKLAFDRVGALTLLAVVSPLLVVVGAAIRLTSPGPVFYRQERIGLNGQPFRMIKFRSMKVGADRELGALLMAQGSSDKPLFKIQDDPRISGIGHFIRRYSIDELPQLLNVIRGEMSLVGPRPQRAEEVALYDEGASRRLRVRPGMTGLWQVSGRSNLTWEEAIQLDTSYVENWSMFGDLQILGRTVRAVLTREGAV